MMPSINITNEPSEKESKKNNPLWIWDRKLDACIKQMNTLEENMALAYYLVRGQSSETMGTNVEANEKYVEMSR